MPCLRGAPAIELPILTRIRTRSAVRDVQVRFVHVAVSYIVCMTLPFGVVCQVDINSRQ